MDNYDVSSFLGLYAKLAELHDENPFKVKAFASAAFNLKKVKEPLQDMSDAQLAATPGVGKTVLGAVKNLLNTNTFPELESIITITPPGVMAMLKIKGLGPKKVQGIWHNMGIDNVEDLFNACRENRLVEQTGFGLKTQGEVMKAIEFSIGAKGKFHYARAEKPAFDLLTALRNEFAEQRTEFTGDFRRCAEVIETIDFITTISNVEGFCEKNKLVPVSDLDNTYADINGFRFRFIFSVADNFNRNWFESTGSAEHLEELKYISTMAFTDEESLYKELNLPFIVPEMREGQGETEYLKHSTGTLLQYNDLKGILHNHTTYSDGLHSLTEMAEAAKKLGYEYLAICDHSRSAGYANGLQIDRLMAQMEEIDKLNATMTPFLIFKGIESDILGDGSLDYPDEVLAVLDIVVASVHSNLKMDQEKAMTRLTKAIENPYTHILGHPTGRLLLVREGYPIDHAYIIDCCAANGVSIELNANPFRLDLDWRWIQYAMEKGVMIGINPDAHEKEGYHDMHFGTLAARKGGLTKEMTLNALGLEAFENWLGRRKNKGLA